MIMRINLHICIILAAFALPGCATREKSYHPPDARKVDASAKRLSDAVTKATDTAARAQSHVVAAQKKADRLASDSATVINQVAALMKLAPPELLGKVADLQTAIEKQLVDEGDLSTHLAGAFMEQGQLAGDLAETKTARLQLQSNQSDYQNEAAKLALWATDERANRIAAEKKVSWYRWHWWGSWFALAAGVIACAGFAVLKFTGRLTLTGARLAAKVAL